MAKEFVTLAKSVVSRILELRDMDTNAKEVVVFFGDIRLVTEFATTLTAMLPENFNVSIDMRHINDSTKYLKGHRFCVSFFHDSCFKVITTEKFLQETSNYRWLQSLVRSMYQQQPSVSSFFSEEDAFQECCMCLDKILSKFDNQCSLRSFIANRMRRYFDYIIMEQLRIRGTEIRYILKQMGQE